MKSDRGPDLFDSLALQPFAAADAELRAALGASIRRCRLSRESIAAEMESLGGSDPDYPVSKAMLDAWTAPSRQGWRFPAIYLNAFVQVTSSPEIIDLFAHPHGRVVLTHEEAAEARIGKLMTERGRIDAELRILRRSKTGSR